MTTRCLHTGVICLVAASVWSGIVRSRSTVSSVPGAPQQEAPSLGAAAPQLTGVDLQRGKPAGERSRSAVSSAPGAPRQEAARPGAADSRLTVADPQRRGTITFLMPHSAASYFLYGGEQMGFEYELAQGFARELGVELDVVSPPPGVELTTWLSEGKGDVIAGLATADECDPGPLSISIPYLDTTAQIITSSERPVLRDVAELAGKTIAVQPDSAYAAQLLARVGAPSLSLRLTKVYSDDGIGEAVRAVTQKEVAAAIVTAPLAGLAQTLYPGKLRTAWTLPGLVHQVWAVRPEQTNLLGAINAYLERANRSGLKKILFDKYFVTAEHLRDSSRKPEFTLISKRLSRYDRLIARHAEEAGFDWRLVAALIFEESRFDHERVSEAGAYGLMQVTPIAAQATGVKNYAAPRGNIVAGVRYLQSLARYFPHGRLEDRLALVLASYLIGPGHVEDAQRLAQALGYDPHCWAESMERVLPLLEDPRYQKRTLYGFAQGSGAVRYVNAVRKRYSLYSQHVSRELAPAGARTETPAQAASAAG